ncbi:DUF3006 domain-containing protein [Clostridium estertheticum]|uniref:DUF3006 domain-containing protein n=1 Tax=Clostridium estertheticum TaxID=238834 RepID=A0A7Y3T265_9CLOT|nr:DUF3006 domain-containing protein [Clostridium estertheticum]NNU78757.1 DUF3006 domain-containing protein [Clostridium estertheticum]WBL49699.1 DUF3006 domain-containing protein [Clostridium estertheticum]
MKVIINRLEGSYAVCEKEDKTMIDINSIDLPFEAKEGDVLVLDNNMITIDIEETEKRHRDIQVLTDDLWE